MKTVPGGVAPGALAVDLAVAQPDARADVVAGDARQHLDLARRRDAGQRLAAEAERRHAPEVVLAGHLARGVALEGEAQLGGVDAAAVVGDADEGEAALADLDGDVRGAGVERVLDQLFDDGGGTLDDLAGGDLRRFVRRQHADRHRRLPSRRLYQRA